MRAGRKRDVTTVPLPWPALHIGLDGIWLADGDGARRVDRQAAIRLLADTPTLLINAPLVASKLGYPEAAGLDVLELFAFVHPARFAVPTVHGLAAFLGLESAHDGAAEAKLLRAVTETLLAQTEGGKWDRAGGAWNTARALSRLKWPWAPAVLAALGEPQGHDRSVFTSLPKWEEGAPPVPVREVEISGEDAADRLAQLTGSGAEERPGQRAYTAAAAAAFRPREVRDAPNVVLAEAGTGIGKTLGYLSPASLWAERSGGTVWLSTYTKALQRQLDHETERLYPDPRVKAARVVVRKGRENYLCLLNLEDAVQGGFAGRAGMFAQLVQRWAMYSRDGDMVGGDLPGWLSGLFGKAARASLTDRRGECVYAGCPHYRRCFIEHAVRGTADADLVIANHALVMVNAVRGKSEGRGLKRIVFDEGHHLFDAADSAFAMALTGGEAIEMRRWIIGPEKRSKGRRRGLAARLGDLVAFDSEGAMLLEDAVHTAAVLPADGWLSRVVEGSPEGPVERLLAAVRAQVFARADAAETGYGLETEVVALQPALIDAADVAARALEAIAVPLARLSQRLEALVEEAPDWLDGAGRARVEGALSGLTWRRGMIGGWVQLLARMGGAADPDFVDWLTLERIDGREIDVGIRRHWLDPTKPFAEAVLKQSHGAVITSATLRSRITDDTAPDADWRDSEARTGASHLPLPPVRFSADSPFDYARQARVLIVTDVQRGSVPALAGAYKALISASHGGALGLFTAISRLRAVHARIEESLAREGLPLFAQHIDPVDAGTLVDMFRADPAASLLGTDALRDGVDVPGDSLRLVVLEGVPWPRPTVLHAARRAAFGGKTYDDLIASGRMAQAFGRLIRRASDRGTFVLLGAAVPSRLCQAFPDGVTVERVPLENAVRIVREMSSPTRNLPMTPGATSGISAAT
ncbi:ATP-dependent DNA helicase [Sphingosinicella soli]|uniref:ATP-dependent DNA helicase n=1 Tax=Sphingosinicella soli TaxID=333708 RepID=UPI00160D3459|nr:ATP-dependent DNA helicase [Sphingosinicella soli]